MKAYSIGVMIHHVSAAATHLRVDAGAVWEEICHAIHLVVRSILHEWHGHLVRVTGEISLGLAIRLAS